MSLDKTQNLQRKDLPINDLEPNLNNPNEMSEQQFNMLYDNIERMGITDPILVRPLKEKKGKYRIIGGHHRWEVAKIFGYEEVPCTIVNDPNFDDDMEKFQMVGKFRDFLLYYFMIFPKLLIITFNLEIDQTRRLIR